MCQIDSFHCRHWRHVLQYLLYINCNEVFYPLRLEKYIHYLVSYVSKKFLVHTIEMKYLENFRSNFVPYLLT